MTYSTEMLSLRNNIDFDIQNLSLELKRKKIEKYKPLFYVLAIS